MISEMSLIMNEQLGSKQVGGYRRERGLMNVTLKGTRTYALHTCRA